MHQLVQILLPLEDDEGRRFPASDFQVVKEELARRFGGVTAFMQSPADGIWEGGSGHAERERIVALEVMAQGLDTDWWKVYRRELERRFRQDEVVIRAMPIQRL